MWIINGYTKPDCPMWANPDTNPQDLLQELYSLNSGVIPGRLYAAKFEVKEGRKRRVTKEAFVKID